MSAILGLPQSLDMNRDTNNAGCFAGAFFANQAIDSGSGYIESMRELTLNAINEAASAETLPLDEVLALLKNHADKSSIAV